MSSGSGIKLLVNESPLGKVKDGILHKTVLVEILEIWVCMIKERPIGGAVIGVWI